MRVLLFVEGADGGLKCVHPNVPEYIWRRGGEKVRERHRSMLPDPALEFAFGAWAVKVRAASRWWLVRAENAEAGRIIIGTKGSETGVDIEIRAEGFGTIDSVGRILASGGREA